MSSTEEFLSAELRREKDVWRLGPECPVEGLEAHAIFDHLVYSNEIEPLTEEDKERMKNLEIRKSQIEGEIEQDTQGLKTHLQTQIEQIDEELSEFDDKYDVYDIIPTNEYFYGNMSIYETSWDDTKYAVGNETETRNAAEEYAENIIDSEGFDFFSESFLRDYIDEDYFKDYIESYYSDVIYQDPDGWLSDDQRQLSNSQVEEIKVFKKRIQRLEEEIEILDDLIKKSPEKIKTVIKNKRKKLNQYIISHEQNIESITEDPKGDFTEEDIEDAVSRQVEDAMWNIQGTMSEFGIDPKEFIDKDALIEGWISDDGFEIMSHYDGQVHEQKVMGTYYVIIRVE